MKHNEQGTYHLPISGLKATNRNNNWKESLEESKMNKEKQRECRPGYK